MMDKDDNNKKGDKDKEPKKVPTKPKETPPMAIISDNRTKQMGATTLEHVDGKNTEDIIKKMGRWDASATAQYYLPEKDLTPDNQDSDT